jgi:dipeptidase E
MKFYLSSYKLGHNPQILADLICENKNIAIIPNALDIYTDLERRTSNIHREKEGLIKIGLVPQELDLKKYFGKQEKLKNELENYGAVWVLGGNTFILRRAYKESGMDKWLQKHKNNKNFVYAGYSAGASVLSPSLNGVELVDDPNLMADRYTPEIIWEGLGLIDFAFVPHFKSDHPESELVDKEVEYYQKNEIKYKTLHDGEVIIID